MSEQAIIATCLANLLDSFILSAPFLHVLHWEKCRTCALCDVRNSVGWSYDSDFRWPDDHKTWEYESKTW